MKKKHKCPACKEDNYRAVQELVQYKMTDPPVKVQYNIEYYKCVDCSTEWMSEVQQERNQNTNRTTRKKNVDLYKLQKWVVNA